MDERRDSGEYYPGGDRRGGDPIDLTFDDAVTRTSARAVKGSGIWAAIWGALTALPTGFTSLYDWVVSQLAKYLPLTGGTMTGELAIGPNPNYSAKFELDPSGAATLLLRDGTGNKLYISGGKLYYQQYDWQVGVELYFPSSDGRLALAAPTATADHLAALDANGNPTDSGIAKTDVALAADLRYHIAEAAVRKTLPADCFPVTFTYEGVSYSINSLVEESEASAVGDMFLSAFGGTYSLGMVVVPGGSEDEKSEVIEVATFHADGVYESGNAVLQFGGVSPVADTSPTLADIQVLADRTENLITAQNGTASIDIELPEAVTVDGVRYCRDLIVDVDNSANASDLGLELASDGAAYLDAGGARYLVAVADGDDLADLLTVAAGKRARLYFTETAQTATPTGGTSAVPVISLQRLTVVVGGAL